MAIRPPGVPSPPPPSPPHGDPERGTTPPHREHQTRHLPAIDPERREEAKKAVDTWMQKPHVRQDGLWPYLLIRGVVGDHGVRPISGSFWESPDIKVVQGDVPSLTGQTPTLNPTAGVDHTIFVHAWNLGSLASYGTRVSVYWANPSFDFNTVPPNLIGAVFADLSDRNHEKSHGMVRIPQLWRPTFVNGGHECLLAKLDALMDGGGVGFDARLNRHVAQRNLMLAPPQFDLSQLMTQLSAAVPAGAELHLHHGMGAITNIAAAHLPDAGIALLPPATPPPRAAVFPNGLVQLGAVAGVNTKQARYVAPEVFARHQSTIITPRVLADTGVSPLAQPVAPPHGVASERFGSPSAAATLLTGLGIGELSGRTVAEALGDGPNVGHLLRFEAKHGEQVIGGYSVIVTRNEVIRRRPSASP